MMQANLTEWFSQIVTLPVFIGVMIIIFFAAYFLTGASESKRKYGLAFSAKTVRDTKHLVMNITLISLGAIVFSFILWQFVSPFQWIDPQNDPFGLELISILIIGLFLGISFGLLTFLSKHRGK